MASKELITYECDSCGKESDDRNVIVNHVVTIDKTTVEVDACGACWERATRPMNRLLALGMRVITTRRRRST